MLRLIVFGTVEETEIVAVRRFRPELAAFVGITRGALFFGYKFFILEKCAGSTEYRKLFFIKEAVYGQINGDLQQCQKG